MKLSSLTIRHFRCHHDTTLAIGPMHAIVGANNAGKSTILHALDLLFNAKTRLISEESFHGRDTSKSIAVEGLFVDLTDGEAKALAPYLRPDGSFHLKRTATIADATEGEGADDDTTERRVVVAAHYSKPQPKIHWLNPTQISGENIKLWWADKDKLVHNGKKFLDLLGSSRPTVGDWVAKAQEFAAQHLTPSDYTAEWTANPKGYSGVLKSTLPHFEMVPAVRDVTEEAKVTKGGPFGRLIQGVAEALDPTLRTEIETALATATQALNRSGGVKRIEEITALESVLRGFLGELMDADLELEFPAPSLNVVLSGPRVVIDDGFRGAASGKGHGMQRAVIFSILRAYAKSIASVSEAPRRPLILGIEEPELYMHPSAQRVVRRVLRGIADAGDQVIVTTHSPMLVDVTYFDEIVRVEATKRAATDGDVTVRSTVHQLPMKALVDDLVARHPKASPSPESMRERYSHVYSNSRNEGFFANKVLLVEGATEAYALPIYARALGDQWDLDGKGVVVVDSGGKGQIERLFRIFNELGIACFVLFDYDRENHDPGLRRETSALFALLEAEEPKDLREALINQKYACFVEDWEACLRDEIPGYEALKQEARDFLGAKEDSKPLIARYVARKLAERTPKVVPATIKAVLEKASTVTCTGSCLHK